MTRPLIFIISLVTLLTACQSAVLGEAGTEPPAHDAWHVLLTKYVADDGKVNYRGFIEEKDKFQTYLDALSNNPPDRKTWSQEEQLAYWINAYNAFTVKLIADNYPVKSIKDLHPTLKIPAINTVWHKKFFKIGDEDANLDEIEHKILRKEFDEPRIHFAINCASVSCPPLRNEAYVAEKIDAQLDDQAKRFINDRQYNEISAKSVKISKIFSWFKGDFTNDGSLIDYLNQYAATKIDANAKVNHKDYNWDLNE